MAPKALEGIFAGEGPARHFGPSPFAPFTFPVCPTDLPQSILIGHCFDP